MEKAELENLKWIFEQELGQEINGEYPLNDNLGARIKFPNTIYHYTDLNGLLGIIQTKSLFATHFSFLNDSQELLYAKEIINKFLKNSKDQLSTVFANSLIQSTAIEFNNQTLDDTFITCFSKEKDLLSQWRGYSRNNQGLAIGFTMNLRNTFRQQIAMSYFIEYNQARQLKIINELIQISFTRLFELKNEYKIANNHFKTLFSSTVSKMLKEHLSLFKDSSFSEEKEYRITTCSSDKKINYRTNNKYVIPYTQFKIEDEKQLLPIEEIVIGPSSHSTLIEDGIHRFLVTNGYNDIKIIQSEIPFRE